MTSDAEQALNNAIGAAVRNANVVGYVMASDVSDHLREHGYEVALIEKPPPRMIPNPLPILVPESESGVPQAVLEEIMDRVPLTSAELLAKFERGETLE